MSKNTLNLKHIDYYYFYSMLNTYKKPKDTEYRRRVLKRVEKAYTKVLMLKDLPIEYVQEAAMRAMHGVPSRMTSEESFRLQKIRYDNNDTDKVFHVQYLLCITTHTPSYLITQLLKDLKPYLKP